MSGLTHAETITKLLIYTVVIFIAPYVAYRAAAEQILPAVHARYGWDAIAEDGGRSVWAGAAAILADDPSGGTKLIRLVRVLRLVKLFKILRVLKLQNRLSDLSDRFPSKREREAHATGRHRTRPTSGPSTARHVSLARYAHVNVWLPLKLLPGGTLTGVPMAPASRHR